MPVIATTGLLREKDRDLVKEQAARYRKSGKRDHLSTKERAKNMDLREKVKAAIDDLVWLMSNWSPDEQSQVFTEDRIAKLVIALLASKFEKESEDDMKARLERQSKIAAVFLEKSVGACLGKLREGYPMFHEHFEREAISMVFALKGAAFGHQVGVNL